MHFLTLFSQNTDKAPAIPTVASMNIVLNGTQDAATIDTTMLAALKARMHNATANIEGNRLDDFTTNAKLLARVNKNVLNPEYTKTTIDWSKFGLTAETHPITGKLTYSAGPNTDVTFMTTDDSMNETVTSGRVNIIDENTVVGPEKPADPTDLTNSYGLKAENGRIHVNNAAALDLKVGADVKGWNLKTGTDETALVTSSIAKLPATVGVYPVTFTYKGLTKTIQMSVYDNNTVAGPNSVNPLDPKNTEMITAVGGTYTIGQSNGKTLDALTGVKAWNVNTGSSVLYSTDVKVGGVAKAFDSKTPGVYDVTYKTTPTGVTKVVKVTLTTGNIPTITANPTVVKMALNDPAPVLGNGVTASDKNAAGTTVDLTSSIKTSGTVDRTKKGVYYVDYSVTDTDFNTVTASRAYVVGADAVGTTHAIFANSFTKDVSAVDTTPAAIISAAGAYAKPLKSGAATTLEIENTGGYKATPGPYKIKFRVKEEPLTAKEVIANVFDNGVVGANYAIEANDVTMTVSSAKGKTPLVLVGAKAWDVKTGAAVTPTYTSSPAYAEKEGVYTITLTAGVAPNQQTLTKKITLTTQGAPVMTVTPARVNLALAAAAPNLLTGVSAKDVAGTVLTVTPTGTVNTAKQGVYNITYKATDKDGTAVTGTRQYIVGNNPKIGKDYVLFAKPFSILSSDVNTAESAIIAKATAEAFKLSDGTSATVKVLDNGGYSNVVGPYFINFSVALEPATTNRILANVYQNGNPANEEIIEATNITKRKTEVAGLTLKAVVGAKAWNTKTGAIVDTTATSTPTYNGNVNTYATTITTTSTLKTAKNVTVNIVAGNKPVIKDTTPIVNLPLKATVNYLTNITVTDTEDNASGKPITAKVTGDTVDTTKPGVYHVTYDAVDSDGNAATAIRRTYTVGAKTVGANYAIFATDFAKRVGQVDTSVAAVVSAANASAVNLQTKAAGTVEIANLSGYSAKVGNFPISLRVKEEATTLATANATVTSGAIPTVSTTKEVVELSVGAAAPNVLADVKATDAEDDANGVALVIKPSTTSIDTTKNGVYKVTYSTTDSDKNISNQLTRTYVVGALKVEGDYAIFASNFTSRASLAPTTDGAILTSTKASAVNIKTNTAAFVTVSDKSKYKAIANTTPYPIELTVTGTTVKAMVYATITSGAAPVLTDSTPRVTVGLNGTVNLLSNITAKDTEDDAAKLPLTITTSGNVNTSVAGVYPVTYVTKDSDGNTSNTLTRSYIVGSKEIVGDYAVFATDFTKSVSEVDTSNAAVFTAANLKIIHIPTNVVQTNRLITLGGYTNKVGAYTIELGTTTDATMKTKVVGTVIGGQKPVIKDTTPVVEVALGAVAPSINANVTVTDVEDDKASKKIAIVANKTTINTSVAGVYQVTYTAQDSDLNPATPVIRTYVVGAAGPVVGDNVIFANNYTKRVGEVVMGANKNAGIITASQAKAVNIKTLAEIPAIVKTDGGYTNVANATPYTITVQATGLPLVVGTVKATVVAGNPPVLTVNNPVVQLAVNAPAQNILANVSATDTEDGNAAITSAIKATGTVDVTKEGVYVISYTVTDTDGNSTATKIRSYVVGAKSVGTNYAIFASDFTKRASEVDTATAKVMSAASAKSVNLKTGAVGGTVLIENNGGYKATAQTMPYQITFAVKEEPLTKATINATVIEGGKPILTDATPLVQVAIGASVNTRANVNAMDAEDGDITKNIKLSGENVDTSQAGIYHVKYNISDVDKNAATEATRIYVVGAKEVNGEYAVFGNDFTKRVGEVVTSNGAILTETKIEVYNLQTKAKATPLVKDKSAYKAVVGSHNIVFNLAEDVDMAISFIGNVISGDSPVLTDKTEIISLPLGAQAPDLLKDVSVKDKEDDAAGKKITIKPVGTVNTSIPEVYHITYTAVDSDTNAATTITRSYVVGAKVVKNNYAIFGNDFTKFVGQVDKTDAGIITDAGPATAQEISTKDDIDVTVKDNGGYDAIPGKYDIALGVGEDATVKADIDATVIAGEIPVLHDATSVVQLNISDTVTSVLSDITVTDKEDDAASKKITITPNVTTIDTSKKGVIYVTYTAKDSDTNAAKSIVRAYVVGSSGIIPNGGEYAIFSDDFTKRVGEVNTTDAEVIKASNAIAVNLKGNPDGTIRVKDLGEYAAVAREQGYTITFEVVENQETVGTSIATVITGDIPVIKDTKPIQHLNVGEAQPALRTDISANDTEDKDITTSVHVTGSVDTSKRGVYIVAYNVTDSDTNTAIEVKRTYIVGASLAEGNYVIFAKDFTIDEQIVVTNDTPGAHAQIVTESKDNDAQNIDDLAISGLQLGTAKVVDDGGYTNAVNAYPVILEIAEAPGKTVAIEATVIDTTAPEAPVINHIEAGDKPVISGTGEIGSKVEVTLPDGSKQTVDVQPDGTWEIESPMALTPEDTITAVVVDPSGNVSEASEKPVVDTTAPEAPEIDHIEAGEKPIISGSGESGSTIEVTLPDGSKITAPIDEDGNWQIESPIALTPEDKVTAVVIDPSGNISTPVEEVVTDTIAPSAPVIDHIESGEHPTISGDGEPNATIEITLPDGSKITTPVDADGKWTIESPIALHPEDEVTAVTKDPSGNTSLPDEEMVTDETMPEAPAINPIEAGLNPIISGDGEAGSTIEVTLPNGGKVTAPIDENGKWEVESPIELNKDDKVTAVVVDPTGNTSLPAEQNVTDTTAPEAPTVNPIEAGDKPVIGGDGEPGSTIEVTLPNGDKITAPIDEDGKWEVESPIELNKDDKVTAVVVDPSGNTSLPAEQNVTDTTAPNAPTIGPVIAGEKPVISGLGEAGSTIEITLPDGSKITAPIDENGKWEAQSPIELKKDDKVTAVVVDPSGNVSPPTEQKVIDTTPPDAPIIDAIEAGPKPIISGDGEPGSTIEITLPNGDKIKTPVDENGKWEVESPIELKPDDKVIAVVIDPSGNTSMPAQQIVKDTTAPEAPTVNEIEAGEKPVIGGTGEPGSTIEITLPDGTVITAPIDENGKWEVESPIELKKDDKITAVVKDPSGNTSPSVEKPVVDTTDPEAPTVNEIEAGEKPVIGGTGEPGSTIEITLPDGTVITAPIDENGKWEVESPIELKKDDKITAVVKDPSGNTSPSVEKPVVDTTAPETPTVNPIEAGPKPIISGEGEPGSTIEITLPNGDKITAPIDKDGKWEIESPIELKKDDKVTAVVVDPSGNTSLPAEQIVTDTTKPEAPTVNEIEAGEKPVIGGTGEPGSTIEITLPDGTVITAPIDENGKWEVESPIELKKDDKITAVVKDPSGNTSPSVEKPVIDTTAPESPSINPIEAGEKPTISGTGEAGSTIEVTFPDGSKITAPIDKDGNWTVESPIDLKPEDKVTAVVIDPSGNISEPTESIVFEAELATFVIDAHDTIITADELQKHIDENSLDTFILTKIEANAYRLNDKKPLTPLTLDNTKLLQENIGGTTQKVKVTYDVSMTDVEPYQINQDQMQQANQNKMDTFATEDTTTNSEATIYTITTVVDVEVTQQAGQLVPGLPVTGENIMMTILMGAMIILSSIFLFIIRRKITRKNEL